MTFIPPLNSFFGASVNPLEKKRKDKVIQYLYLGYMWMLVLLGKYGLYFRSTTLLQRFGASCLISWASQDGSKDQVETGPSGGSH